MTGIPNTKLPGELVNGDRLLAVDPIRHTTSVLKVAYTQNHPRDDDAVLIRFTDQTQVWASRFLPVVLADPADT